MSGPDYQVVYGVGVLDDVHNYFPSLLYDQGRFQTLPQVLSYVRSQMNTRFNLFAYGASLHRASAPAPVPSPSPVVPEPVVTRPAARTRDAATMNILLGLLGLGTDIRLVPDLGLGIGPSPQGPRAPADIWASFNTPVVVAPSAEIIAANTEIIEASAPVDLSGAPLTQNICTVCQDAMRPPEVCRRLRPCQHSFHRGCIDEWFRRSVFCPSCRHDIRNPTPSPRLGATTEPAIIPQENVL